MLEVSFQHARRIALGTGVVNESGTSAFSDSVSNGEETMISLVQASTATPQNKFSTTELVATMMHKFSPELINSICSLGVENRYSTMNNYAEFLNGAPMNQTGSTTDLGVNATRKCIEEWGGDPSQIGLLIAATNTPDQMLPCLASEVMGRTH